MARRLASAASEKSQVQYNWQVSVIRSDEVNAFCLPGGEIVVYTGILPLTGGAAGLATVLGHEMAHAVSRHGAQRMFDQQLTQAALMGVQGGVSQMDPQQQAAVMAALGAGAQYGVTLPFSRNQESEADHIGLIYMARAGYDPHEALAFWKRMDAKTSAGCAAAVRQRPSLQRGAHPADRRLDARGDEGIRRFHDEGQQAADAEHGDVAVRRCFDETAQAGRCGYSPRWRFVQSSFHN